MTVLKAALRLSGTASTDSLAILDRAVEKARVGFYDALGASRVSTIVAMTYSENPTTTNGITRAKANQTEVSWVRMLLLQELPSMFVDGGGQVGQTWNEEGLTRDASAFDTETQITRLKNEIDGALQELSTSQDSPKMKIKTIGPSTSPNYVGMSLYT
jgi:hypothetical protein